MIGGHVDPRITNVDLIRAFESVRGSNLEVPMITTAINTPSDSTASVSYTHLDVYKRQIW